MPNQRISQPNSTSSPPWGRTTKAIAGVFAILLIILVIWRFQELLTPLIIALILAYLLQPVINLAIRYTGWKRGWVVLLVYVTALIIWTVLAIALGVSRRTVIRDRKRIDRG
jgi:predicted PurR-regulated permease PerM